MIAKLLCLAAATALVRKEIPSSHFAHSVSYTRRLRLCNAYAASGDMEIFAVTPSGAQEKLTKDGMPYKACEDFPSVKLSQGSKIQFHLNGAELGEFMLSELPLTDSLLYLAINRRDTTSTAVSFESHVFAQLKNVQLAVIDMYRGTESSNFLLEDVLTQGAKVIRSEKLNFESVVALNQGNYEALMNDGAGALKQKLRFDAHNHENYVLMRVGIEGDKDHPQEMVMFPPQGSGAAMMVTFVAFFAMLF